MFRDTVTKAHFLGQSWGKSGMVSKSGVSQQEMAAYTEQLLAKQ